MSLHSDDPQFDNLQALVEFCASFYENNQEKLNDKSVRENRKELASFIERFHMESGTLTSEVKEKIITLRQGAPMVLMTAHQPNLFPYSGVLRKATLIFVLERELERQFGFQVINFFGIADQDFTNDRWVKSSLLPAIDRRDGKQILSINLPQNIILRNVPKPSITTINKWKDEIKTWLHNATYLINNFCRDNGISYWNYKELLLYNNFEVFWDIVKEAYEQATNYSDFNAFIISKIINEVWGYDTLFSRFSDCQKIFTHEFHFLISHFCDYSASLKEVIKLLSKNEVHARAVKTEVKEKEIEVLPFWYHCPCGSKVRLSLRKKYDYILGFGFCSICNKEYNINLGKVDNPDVSPIASHISARAIPMILVFSKGLGLSYYVGGIGGIEYLKKARYIANKLGITMPPIMVWRPRDKYLNISELNALFRYKQITGNYEIYKWIIEIDNIKSNIQNIYDEIELIEEKKWKVIENLRNGNINMESFHIKIKKISNQLVKIKKTSNLSILHHNLKILENIQSITNLIPNVIDYAINIGLSETSEQWINYLVNNGSLSSDIYLKSILDDLTEFEACEIFQNIQRLWLSAR